MRNLYEEIADGLDELKKERLTAMIDKTRLRSDSGAALTQSLFLEHQYDTDRAVFTLKDEDYEYKGVVYLSLKRLFIEMEDIGEYEFATTILSSWDQWQRLCANKAYSKVIDGWRVELEAKLRGKAINAIAEEATGSGRGALQAAKWIAAAEWRKKSVGRPTKDNTDYEDSVQKEMAREFKADGKRLKGV